MSSLAMTRANAADDGSEGGRVVAEAAELLGREGGKEELADFSDVLLWRVLDHSASYVDDCWLSGRFLVWGAVNAKAVRAPVG